MSDRIRAWVALALGCAGTLSAAAPEAIAVSPGAEAEEVEISSHCPTFDWGSSGDPSVQQLVVYRVEERAPGRLQTVRNLVLPGSARGWTPSLEDCFEPGYHYAWTVRGGGPEGDGPWSPPLLFRVGSEPTSMDALLAELVVHLERHPEARDAVVEALGLDGRVRAREPTGPSPAPGRRPSLGSARSTPEPVPLAQSGPGQLMRNLGLFVSSSGSHDEAAVGIYSYVYSGDANGYAEAAILGEAEDAGGFGGAPPGVHGISAGGSGVVGEGLVGVEARASDYGARLSSEGPSLQAWGSTCCNGGTPLDYSAWLDNVDDQSGGPDVLALGSCVTSPTEGTNYIGFFDTTDSGCIGRRLLGEIEGDGRGGIHYKGAAITLTPTDTPGTCDGTQFGRMYMDASLRELCYCDGLGAWLPVDGSGSC